MTYQTQYDLMGKEVGNAKRFYRLYFEGSNQKRKVKKQMNIFCETLALCVGVHDSENSKKAA